MSLCYKKQWARKGGREGISSFFFPWCLASHSSPVARCSRNNWGGVRTAGANLLQPGPPYVSRPIIILAAASKKSRQKERWTDFIQYLLNGLIIVPCQRRKMTWTPVLLVWACVVVGVGWPGKLDALRNGSFRILVTNQFTMRGIFSAIQLTIVICMFFLLWKAISWTHDTREFRNSLAFV